MFIRTRCLFVFCALLFAKIADAQSLDQSGVQWGDVLEWTLDNPTIEGNPFDLNATVTFTHAESGETRRTGLFYAGSHQWKFRFIGTRTGDWKFETASDDVELNQRRGTVRIDANPNPHPLGLVVHHRNRWMWSASEQAFVPQIVMYRSPDGYYQRPDLVDQDLKTWFVDHGFNGLHTDALCRWFDLEKTSSDEFDTEDPNPDPRTFEALEMLITKAHAAGGFVHIWAWGDESRGMTPSRWGINGKVDQRLQRYIAARLGPLPGWTMGYGFDLWEWVGEEELVTWHAHMHEHLGWPHLLGGRVHQHGTPLNRLITSRLDYVGYETHRPDARTYLQAMEMHPEKPVFMEDRFRVRVDSRYPEKDYDLEQTRRGLWHSAMAGGVANIWGYLVPEAAANGMSQPYPNREQIRTYSQFFAKRFTKDSVAANDLTNGLCLMRPDGAAYIFYVEDTTQVRLDLLRMPEARRGVAVDTRAPYREIDLGLVKPLDQVWTAPHRSDWAIAIGDGK